MRAWPFSAHLAAAALAVGAAVAGAACVSPELEGTNWACAANDECGNGFVCSLDGGTTGRCVALSSDGPIRLGMSAPFQGPNGDLGIEMRRGMRAYFERVNRQGGLRGRDLLLDSRDDGYDPALARQNTLDLLDVRQEVEGNDQPDIVGPNGVLALVGNVGTPTALASAPLATKNRTIFFAPFTGANEYLRDGTKSPYVFNYRASYYEETAAMADFLFRVRSPRIADHEHVIAFVQNDTFGEAGYSGFSNAYNAITPLPNPQAITRITYERDNPVASTEEQAVPAALARLQALLPPPPTEGAAPQTVSVAIVMVDTYSAGATLIRRVKDWINEDALRAQTLDVAFLHVSFVGSDALAEQLTTTPASYVDIATGARRTYAGGVIVTQVVPDYASQAPGVAEYRTDIGAFDQGNYSFNSLEGYIAAKLFVEALRRHEGPLTSTNLVSTLENKMVNVDVGIGQPLNFSLSDHQASHRVWGSQLQDDAKFRILWTWTPTERIVQE